METMFDWVAFWCYGAHDWSDGTVHLCLAELGPTKTHGLRVLGV